MHEITTTRPILYPLPLSRHKSDHLNIPEQFLIPAASVLPVLEVLEDRVIAFYAPESCRVALMDDEYHT